MKKSLFILSFLWLGMFAFSQSPQSLLHSFGGINYQTVIRDGDGQLLANTAVTLRMTIYENAPDGAAVYRETHSKTTNAYGLVNLVIGQGAPSIGSFTAVNWGKSAFYLETAVDLTGGGQFQVMGVTQFVSVPYALFSVQSGGILSMTTEERDALENPLVGMQIYNSTSNCLNYFNGAAWFETCGQCTPLPSQASAGEDQYFADATFSTPLQGNIPEHGTGTWTIESGTGGSFANANDPQTLFTGQMCESYSLKWTISTVCASNSDIVNITFDATPTLADAGQDVTVTTEALSLNLAANTPEVGTGQWTIFSGEGGTFANPGLTTTIFTGQSCTAYLLVWEISSSCHSSSDTVSVTFFTTPTTANAGENQIIPQLTWTTLAANTPLIGQGQWTIMEGTGGQLVTPNSPNSLFLGQSNSLYILQWKISSVCTFSTDDVQIIFGCAPQPTTANAGPDQLNLAGTSATLQGNIPDYGTGQWSVVTGAGGTISNPENPTSNFTGQIGITYELRWTISNSCGSTNDNVIIGFFGTCGLNFTDSRDGQSYSTVQIGTQCWMAQNLNIGTRINETSNQTNNGTIEKYCYSNTESNCTTYGGLYQWDEMMQYTTAAGVKGICPTGWHLPTDAEWTTLTTYLGGESVAGGKMKETGTTHWTSPNTSATNSSGFTGLPGGYRDTDGTFYSIGNYGYFWSSSEYSTTYAWTRYLYYGSAVVIRSGNTKGYGFSVRCVRD